MAVATDQLETLRSVVAAAPATEAAQRERFRVDGVTPAAVVEPADANELAEIVRWARAHRAALLPVTSGVYLPLGNPPQAVDVAVSLSRLNRVVHYDPGDLTFGAGAGLLLAQAQEQLAADGLFLPADPPYAERAALGGLLAANASGPLRYAYGTWRDFVVGVKFVTGEGKLVKSGGRVVKNVAGYDLAKLLIGSLGTLGVIAEINFKCFPAPPETASFIFTFTEREAALETRRRIVHSAWQPRALELLDPQAARLAAAAPLSPEHWSLVVSVGGVDAVIMRYNTDFSALARAAKTVSFAVARGESETALWKALQTLLPRMREANPAATVVKAALPLSGVGPFLAKALPIAERYELPVAATAHAGTGVAFVYLLPMAMPDAAARCAQAATEMIHAGNNLGGRVSLPWCPTEVKRDVNPWGPLRDDFSLMKKLKAQFDPDGVLNPGRYVGGI